MNVMPSKKMFANSLYERGDTAGRRPACGFNVIYN
jgi:hypothetical protein